MLLSNFILQAIKQEYGLVLVDGKGDTGNGSILEITKQFCDIYHRKLYVINMSEPVSSSVYNPFCNSTVTVCKDMLINLSDWTEPHYKHIMERYLQLLIKLMKFNNIPISLKAVSRYSTQDNLCQLSADALEEGFITKEEHINNIDFINVSAKVAEMASARFATLAEGDFEPIFAEENGINIYSAIKEKAVILFVLNPLLYPESSQSLGRLALIDAKQAVSRLFENNKRSFFIFDEVNVYASTVLLDLINKSRSAGVTCFVATQSLADLESAVTESFKKQLIENCNNYLIMRQNTFSSAEEWSKTIGTHKRVQMTYQVNGLEDTEKGSARVVHEFIVHPDSIKNLPQGECYFLSKDNQQLEHVRVNKPF